MLLCRRGPIYAWAALGVCKPRRGAGSLGCVLRMIAISAPVDLH